MTQPTQTQDNNTTAQETATSSAIREQQIVEAVKEIVDNGHIYVQRDGKAVITPKLVDYKMEVVVDREEKVVSVYLGAVRGYLRIAGEQFNQIDSYLGEHMSKYHDQLSSRLIKIAQVSKLANGTLKDIKETVEKIDEIKKEIREEDKELLEGDRKKALLGEKVE